MKATCSSETSVDFQRTIRRYLSKDGTAKYVLRKSLNTWQSNKKINMHLEHKNTQYNQNRTLGELKIIINMLRMAEAERIKVIYSQFIKE
jgi:hypothetical protein